MTTRTLTFTIEPPTPRQLPIDRTDISLRVSDEFPWTLHDERVGEGVHEVVFQNVQPGEIQYQMLTYDSAGTATEVIAIGNLGFDAPPGAVNVTIVDTE